MTLFQKIIARDIPSDILFEDKDIIAFFDINPENEGHFLVVPKVFSENLKDIKDEDLSVLIIKAKNLAIDYIKDNNKNGFKIKINNGKEAGQEIFHTHVHVIPY